jgi:hypothetical protein
VEGARHRRFRTWAGPFALLALRAGLSNLVPLTANPRLAVASLLGKALFQHQLSASPMQVSLPFSLTDGKKISCVNK